MKKMRRSNSEREVRAHDVKGDIVKLSLVDSRIFADAILFPLDPSPDLVRAFALNSELIIDDLPLLRK